MFTMKNWFLKRGLRNHKERSLFELEMDAKYITEFKGKWLSYDESKDRQRYAVLSKKEELTEAEQKEFETVKANIAISKATKNEYEKTVQLANDVRDYLTILR